MSGGGNPGSSGGGTGGSQTPSWAGGTYPDTFDPKTLGTKFFSDLSRTYDQGPKVNPFSDFVDYSGQTKNAISGGIGDFNRASGQLRGAAYGGVGSQNPFYLSGPDFSKGFVGDLAGGRVDLGNNYDSGILKDVAGGKYLAKGGNPYLEGALRSTRDDILKDVGSQFTSSGRFGGGSYVDKAVDSLSTAENTARLGQYNQDYGNMIQALGLQDSARMRDVNGRLQGLGLQQGQAADRRSQFETEYGRKMGALDRIDAGRARSLGYSGLLDSKAKEKRLSDQAMWGNQNDAGYNHLAKYLGLLRGGDSANETNKPLSIWDILGGVGSFVEDVL